MGPTHSVSLAFSETVSEMGKHGIRPGGAVREYPKGFTAREVRVLPAGFLCGVICKSVSAPLEKKLSAYVSHRMTRIPDRVNKRKHAGVRQTA